MPPDNVALRVAEALRSMVRSTAGVTAETPLAVREEPHCPDPGCPLRRTVVEWRDAAGTVRRLVVVKPAAYVRQADIARALRQPAAQPGKS